MEITTDYAPDLPQPKEKKALSEYTIGFITTLDICPTSKETQKAVTQLAEKLAAARRSKSIPCSFPSIRTK